MTAAKKKYQVGSKPWAADGDSIPGPRATSADFAQKGAEHGVLSCMVEWLEIAVPRMQNVA